MRLISTFPARSAHNPEILNLQNPASDYPNIRVAAVKLLKTGHLSDILAASYARLIVDEYQDCSIPPARNRGLRGPNLADLRSRRSHAGNLWFRK
jgi:hypothetical protein